MSCTAGWHGDRSEGLRLLCVQVKPNGRIPTARSGHTLTYVPEYEMVVLFGGWTGASMSNEVHIMSVAGDPKKDWRWQQLKVRDMRRTRHRVTISICVIRVLGLPLALSSTAFRTRCSRKSRGKSITHQSILRSAGWPLACLAGYTRHVHLARCRSGATRLRGEQATQ